MTNQVSVGTRVVGDDQPTYFIADIAANHDGDLARAKTLIHLAAASGADAAKFQNFQARDIVSDRGFRALGDAKSHQAKWSKSVYETYQSASVPLDWTPILVDACREVGIDYFTSPYDLRAVDELASKMPAIKVGSGDVTWIEIVERIASKGKPVFLATGASDICDVQRAVTAVRRHTDALVLMQCNTNYTGSLENFDHVHLRVLRTYATMWPDLVLGLSDHTPGHAAVLGAVALGARAVEKHFTDDRTRVGPDHGFSLDPATWREMVDRTRELERALGSPDKRVADNESETVVLQRRCMRASRDISAGEIVTRDMIDMLRPAPADSIKPYELDSVVGSVTVVDIPFGERFTWRDLGA